MYLFNNYINGMFSKIFFICFSTFSVVYLPYYLIKDCLAERANKKLEEAKKPLIDKETKDEEKKEGGEEDTKKSEDSADNFVNQTHNWGGYSDYKLEEFKGHGFWKCLGMAINNTMVYYSRLSIIDRIKEGSLSLIFIFN